MKHTHTLLIALLLASLASLQAAEPPCSITPPALWKDYDPNQGDFKEGIVKEETRDGIYSRDSYISAYILGYDVRVFCKYAVKADAVKAAGLLNVHGWMATANIDNSYVDDGWAVMSFDYCGKDARRKDYTKYPEALRHGNMSQEAGPCIHDTFPDGRSITDPKQSSEYLWYAIERRVLSYLERQKEVDKTRLGAKGYSYGGTLMWNLGMDPRIKAIVAYFGIGWIEYYRNKAVWMYNVPYVTPPKTSGEELFLSCMSPEAHVPYITAATLWLSGSNDHHGGHERSLESFKRFKPGVPWSYAIQARGHHNTEKIEQDAKLWLAKYVLGKEVFWPDQPKSGIRLDGDGVPELAITPAQPEKVRKVEMWYALKSPVSFSRSWRYVDCVKSGAAWIGKIPVLNVDDYFFGYGNVTYDNAVVRSTEFNAAIPSRLGKARATDNPSPTGRDALSSWTDTAEAEGPGGVRGMRPTDNNKGTCSEQFSDPKWLAPHNSQLRVKFYCTEPQSLIISADDRFNGVIEITASDNWQEMVLPASRLMGKDDQPMKDWFGVRKIQFKPKKGSDIFKVIFAETTWVSNPKHKEPGVTISLKRK
jgi:hypothetical protein